MDTPEHTDFAQGAREEVPTSRQSLLTEEEPHTMTLQEHLFVDMAVEVRAREQLERQ